MALALHLLCTDGVLEGKVVSAILRSIGSRSKGIGSRLRSNGGLSRSSGEVGSVNISSHCTYRVGVDLAHIESADAVEPASVIFMSIDVKRNGKLLAYLYVETLQTVGTKYRKDHLLGICVVGFDDKFLHFPFTAL